MLKDAVKNVATCDIAEYPYIYSNVNNKFSMVDLLNKPMCHIYILRVGGNVPNYSRKLENC